MLLLRLLIHYGGPLRALMFETLGDHVLLIVFDNKEEVERILANELEF